mgnify:CR=1 FL=1
MRADHAVDVVIAVHSPTRPVERAVRSALAGAEGLVDGVRELRIPRAHLGRARRLGDPAALRGEHEHAREVERGLLNGPRGTI